VDGPGQTAIEGFFRRPSKVGNELGGVDRITSVMSRPVGDEADQVAVARTAGARAALVEQVADRLYDLKVAALVSAADIVALAGLPLRGNDMQGARVILDVEPVAYVAARAV